MKLYLSDIFNLFKTHSFLTSQVFSVAQSEDGTARLHETFESAAIVAVHPRRCDSVSSTVVRVQTCHVHVLTCLFSPIQGDPSATHSRPHVICKSHTLPFIALESNDDKLPSRGGFNREKVPP